MFIIDEVVLTSKKVDKDIIECYIVSRYITNVEGRIS